MMLIEKVILDFLVERLDVPVGLEKLSAQIGSYVVFEKTSGTKKNQIPSSTFAFQSYAPSLYEATELNEQVKEAVEHLVLLDEISGIHLNSDYNFTDTSTKEYRYQAVFDINHY